VTTTIPTDLRGEFEKKIRRGIFNPVARFLPEDVREDRLQDAIAQTWQMYERYAARGELLDDALLVHSCRLRATDASRYYVPCDGYQRKRDALDPRNFMDGRIEVLRFGDFADEDEHRCPDEDEAPVGVGFAEATSNNPTRKILSAIDLTAWLEELPAEDRRMLELRAAGFTLEETAAKLGVSTSCVFANCKRLGQALAEHAGIYIQPKKRKARAPSRSKVGATGRQQGPSSGVRPVKKVSAQSVSRSSTSRSRTVAVVAA
jgi:DNA-directed RNA polymerase specialized sigma24 family protein